MKRCTQGSAATEFTCGGRFYFAVFRSLSTNLKVKELLKSVHICQSYRKFYGPRCTFKPWQLVEADNTKN